MECAQELAKQNEDMDCKVVARDVFSLLVSWPSVHLSLQITRWSTIKLVVAMPFDRCRLRPAHRRTIPQTSCTANHYSPEHALMPLCIAGQQCWCEAACRGCPARLKQHCPQPRPSQRLPA